MREYIILAGGYNLDIKDASALRALGQAQMFQRLGYQTVVLGKFKNPPISARQPGGFTIDNVTCRDILQPVSGRSFLPYVRSAEPLMQVIDELGADRVKAILCYNYPARGAWSIIRHARRQGIAPILDITEWYGWEGRKVLRNLWRLSGVEIRIRILTRIAGNISCSSRWFRKRVAGQHTVLWPFVLDTTRPEWQRGNKPDPNRPAHLVYSGSPGLAMHKDRLPVLIASAARLAAEGHAFRISIAGITRDDYLTILRSDEQRIKALDDKLLFLGRISHTESLALLRDADFSIFFREPNRVSNTGFATKFVEAATLGVPVISNPTSDIPIYLRDGENGIMAASIADSDVDDALRRAVSLTPDQRTAMVDACRAQNPFDMRAWQDEARVFLENLRSL